MASLRAAVGVPAVAAPVLLFLYGVLRLIDGADGAHGPGLAWDLGHSFFFLGFALLGVLTAGMRRLLPAGTARKRLTANVATAAGLFGVACFLWVIAGDLFAGFRDAAPLPEVLQVAGPLAFQLGSLTLMVMLVADRPRRLPPWSPALVLAGFLLIAVDLDLIPVAAIALLWGLAPLAASATNRSRSRRTGRSSGFSPTET